MSNRLASSLGTIAGGTKYFTLSSSNPYPSFDIPLFLPISNGLDFVSSSSFTQSVGIYEYNNFTISTGHQMTVNPGLTIIRCAGTFTCGGNGIIGALGDPVTIGDGYPKTPGTDGLGIANSDGENATGTSATGGGGAGGNAGFGGVGGAGGNAGSGGGGGGSNGYNGGGGGGSISGGGGGGGLHINNGFIQSAGGAGGINGVTGKVPGCLIVIANAINISSNITLIGSNGTNAGNGGNGGVDANSIVGGGGGGGGAGGAGVQGGIFIGLGNTINHSSGVINVSGGNGGDGGNGGNGANANYPGGGGGAGAGGNGGSTGFVFLKAQNLITSGTITANPGTPGTAGTPGTGGGGSAQAGYNAGTSTVGSTYISLNPIQTITGSPF